MAYRRKFWAGCALNTQPSCPAKAVHPVFQSDSRRSIFHDVLDRPLSRTLTNGVEPAMVPAMTNPPFFTRDNDAFIPTPVASGPWDPNSLHGRVIIGLLAFAIEQRHGADDFVLARLTVDMFRLPSLAPIEVTTKLIRDGMRIKVVEADFYSGGVSMARASCQLLRKTENPQGQVWSPPTRHAPAPDDFTAIEDLRRGRHGKGTVRSIVGSMGTVGPR